MSRPSIDAEPPRGGSVDQSDGRARRRNGTHTKLFDAAIDLAAERGIDGTSVDDIAERAGVAKGTVYYNFASKDDLFRALFEERINGLAERLLAAVAGRTGRDAVAALVTAEIAAITAAPELASLILAEGWRTGRPWEHEVERGRRQLVAVVGSVLQEAAPRTLKTPTDTSVAAAALLGATLVSTLEQLSETQGMSARARQAQLAALETQLIELYASRI